MQPKSRPPTRAVMTSAGSPCHGDEAESDCGRVMLRRVNSPSKDRNTIHVPEDAFFPGKYREFGPSPVRLWYLGFNMSRGGLLGSCGVDHDDIDEIIVLALALSAVELLRATCGCLPYSLKGIDLYPALEALIPSAIYGSATLRAELHVGAQHAATHPRGPTTYDARNDQMADFFTESSAVAKMSLPA
ncbi:hypothetical protein BDN71DRAFT_1498746 [Pleurotus eryngii]|uniref:Uncharacterized protein n=1 Tax=Pleurotus eryngii TaxID=5323 RepID=A0A9P6D3T8_PLEER|nr:hypothetical protein BDN71DRAFT_1498746 [Pleurotus eryngii]